MIYYSVQHSCHANICAECCRAGGCQEICQLCLEGGGRAGTSQLNKHYKKPGISVLLSYSVMFTKLQKLDRSILISVRMDASRSLYYQIKIGEDRVYQQFILYSISYIWHLCFPKDT